MLLFLFHFSLPVTVKLATTSEPVNTESTTPCSLSPECSNSSSTTTTVTTSKATISSVSQEHAGSSNTTTTVSSVPFPKNSVPYSTNNSKEERFSPVPVSHSITVPNCTPIIQSYEIPSNHIDGEQFLSVGSFLFFLLIRPLIYCLICRKYLFVKCWKCVLADVICKEGIIHLDYETEANTIAYNC